MATIQDWESIFWSPEYPERNPEAIRNWWKGLKDRWYTDFSNYGNPDKDGLIKVKAKIDALQTEINSKTTQLNQLNTDNTQLKKDKEKLTTDFNQDESDKRTLSNEIEKLKEYKTRYQTLYDFWVSNFHDDYGAFNLVGLQAIKNKFNTQDTINNKWKETFGGKYGDTVGLGGIMTIKADLDRATTNQQQSQQNTDSIIKKLMIAWTHKITEQTELFYQDLHIDNNLVNEAYGDRNLNYLERLTDLNTDSDPEEVINAFKIIATIKATEKAQGIHEKNKDKITTLPKHIKKTNLEHFNEIKETWDMLTEEPTADNNPLYLPIITQKQDYITKIDEIINLWQDN